MLSNWGQTASLLSGPWCPHRQNSPSTPWGCQVQHRGSQRERLLEVQGISLLTNCLPGKPARWLCSEVYLEVSAAPDLQLPTGLLQFAQVWQQCSTLPQQPKGCCLIIWTLIYCYHVGRPCYEQGSSSVSSVNSEPWPRLKKQAWSHPSPLFQDAERFLQIDWFLFFYFFFKQSLLVDVRALNLKAFPASVWNLRFATFLHLSSWSHNFDTGWFDWKTCRLLSLPSLHSAMCLSQQTPDNFLNAVQIVQSGSRTLRWQDEWDP